MDQPDKIAVNELSKAEGDNNNENDDDGNDDAGVSNEEDLAKVSL